MGRTIFLSYSRIDKALVPPLLKGLDRLRHEVWLDEQLEGGQTWWDEVLAQLRACDVALVCVSEAMLDSDACKAELRYAQALGKPVLPVALETLNADLLPANLGRLQIVDYTPTNPQAPFDLMAALENLPAAPPLPDPLPEPPAVPISYLSSLGELVREPSLTIEQQYAVIQKLRAGLYRPRDREGVIGLMQGMREREDLYVSTSRALDEAFEEAARTAPVPAPVAPASPAPAAEATAARPSVQPAAPAPSYFSGPTPPAAPPRPKSRRKLLLVGLAVALLLAVGAGMVAAYGNRDQGGGTDNPGGTTVGAVGDACLVGSWRSSALALAGDSGENASGGSGLTLEITTDGDATYDFGSMEPVTVTVGGSENRIEFTGQLRTTVRAPSPGAATETIVSNTASFQAFVDGQAQGSSTPVDQGFLQRYSCSDTTLTSSSGSDSLTFERQ
ncbi:toll/interleukin-1 receptor domain-containing protein [Terrabacter sp. NPDC000476]|uniref:toll/interleukin-1 receptor domain-containing protein n=1 Tax=Terrabacter sp. NPDC000476 TaxID=3154258 RepID=UPI00332FE73F